jgi:ketosteroid isomerase-like protein
VPTESESLELVRRGFDAFSRRDLDESLAEMHPEIEWHVAFRMPDLPPDKDIYRGRQEVRELWESLLEVWDSLTIEVEEVLEDRDHLLVLRTRFTGRSTRHGVDIERVVYYVMEVQERTLRRVRPFESRAEALEAARVDD